MQDQVCNDVAKRLHLLEDSWRSGRLSLSVRRRMTTLSLGNQSHYTPTCLFTSTPVCLNTHLSVCPPFCFSDLQAGRWDSADEIHRSLMVDHVTEVSQWMVGVKRLIAETRKLSPELLEPLLKPAEPGQDSVEPDQEAVKPDQEAAEPVKDSTKRVQDPTEPVLDPVSES